MSIKIPMPEFFGTKFCITGDSIDADATKYSSIGAFNAGLTFVKNVAVGGRTTAQMLAGFDAELGNVDYDILLIKGGTNDVSGSIANSVTISNLNEIVKKCVSRGKKAIVILPPPRSDSLAEATIKLRDYIMLYFTRIGVPCLDPFASLINPTNGYYTSGATNDNVHPTRLGHGVAGDALTTLLRSIIKTNGEMKPVANFKAAGLISNPLMLTDSNSDGWANNYSDSSGVFTPSIESDADFLGGKCQKVVIGTSTANSYIRILTGGFTQVSKVHFHVKMKLESYDESYYVLVHLQSTTSGFHTVAPSVITDKTLSISSIIDADPTDRFYYVYFEIKKGSGENYSGTLKYGELQVTPIFV